MSGISCPISGIFNFPALTGIEYKLVGVLYMYTYVYIYRHVQSIGENAFDLILVLVILLLK